jgi:NAD(P)H-dependent flavin oxidoreductase YrpB (nitropropane dioxygenase family)
LTSDPATHTRSPSESRLHTRVCDLLGIIHPIVMGGMGPPHTSPELVAAVSNAGGLGILGCSGFSTAQIEETAARIRALTTKPFGLNLLLFASDDAAIDAVLAVRPAVASFAWPRLDQPLEPVFRRAHAAGALVMHMVPEVPQALRAVRAGADVVVAQGSEGGGHVGLMATLVLVPMAVDAVAPLPVLAAGGIADGRGLAAALALGAEGVLLGTRFLATTEAPLPGFAKQAIIESDGHDTDLTEIPDLISGRVWPGALSRVRRNRLIRQWSGREWELRQRRAEAVAAAASARDAGDAEGFALYMGQDAGLIHAVEPVTEVMHRMTAEAHSIVTGRLKAMTVR